MPEIGAPIDDTDKKSQWKWLSSIGSQHAIKPLILTFDYKIKFDGVSIWQSLAEQGVALPDVLLRKQEEIGVIHDLNVGERSVDYSSFLSGHLCSSVTIRGRHCEESE